MMWTAGRSAGARPGTETGSRAAICVVRLSRRAAESLDGATPESQPCFSQTAYTTANGSGRVAPKRVRSRR